MGSTGYLSCGLCHQCGKCYPRAQACPACGAGINLDDDACPSCGAPITDAMRARARAAFMAAKRAEVEAVFSGGGARRSQGGPSRPAAPSFPKGPSVPTR